MYRVVEIAWTPRVREVVNGVLAVKRLADE